MDDTNGIDYCSEAQLLAKFFLDSADSVRSFKEREFDNLSPAQRQQLSDSIEQLENLNAAYCAEGIGDLLKRIQPELANLQTVTAEAKQTLKTLTTIDKVTLLASAAIELGAAALTGDYGTVATEIENMYKVITVAPKPAPAVADTAKGAPGI